MKRFANLLMAGMLLVMPLMFSACDNSNPWNGRDNYGMYDYELARRAYFQQFGAFGTDDVSSRNWFYSRYPQAGNGAYESFMQRISVDILNIDKVLDAYFDNRNGFGAFGTDMDAARRWFFSNCNYANDADFTYFWQEALKDIQRSKSQMAAILSGAAWRGNVRIFFRSGGGQYSQIGAEEELDFDLAQTGGTYGRGQEKRTNMGDGSADNVNTFNWEINDHGNIIIDFDDANLGQGKGVEMVVFFKDLVILDDKNFQGRMTSNTQGLDEYDEFELVRASYISPADRLTRSVSGAAARIFSGQHTKLHKLPEMRVLPGFSSQRR